MNKQTTTNNITALNKDAEIIKKHFSHCFDKNGNFDLEKFKSELSKNEIDFSNESYGMDWLGKSYARLLASDEATTLLKEDKKWNDQPQNTNSQNLLIKGDNLEVLKHLSSAYYEKVKMIYIDPPYNTGGDGFVYQDDRKFTVGEFRKLAGVDEEKAKRILDFVDSKSNSHSAWLTFMYPRLYIAKQLLMDEGAIFVSIDDNEVAQLKLLMDEVFGDENFIGQLPWKGRSGAEDDAFYRRVHEYILVYGKSVSNFDVGLEVKTDEKFPKFDSSKNRYYKTQLLRKWGDNSKREDRPNLYYSIKDDDGNEFYPTLPDGSDGCWRWEKSGMEKAIKEGKIEFNQNKSGKKEAYEKVYEPKDGDFNFKKFNTWLVQDSDNSGSSTGGTNEVKLLFENKKIFNRPKPTILLRKLLEMVNIAKEDTVLDFFAGSGTTGDAVMQLNAEDSGSRKYIIVQLAEEIDKKKDKVAYDFVKNDLGVEQPTIFDITKERLIRAGKKIQKDNKDLKEPKDLSNVDFGFKVFETTPIWDGYDIDAEDFDSQMELFNENKLSDEDLQTLLTTWKTYDGVPLTQNVVAIHLGGYTAFYLDTRLYLMNKGFGTKNLKKLLDEIDVNNDFNPRTVIAFGYNFESKMLRELAENIKNYANKKEIDIDFIARY